MLRTLFFLLCLFAGSALAEQASVPQGVTVPSWKQLSAEQQKDLQNFSQRWDSMPASRRVQILERYDRWKKLPPAKREALREGVQNFQEMTPRQRQNMRESIRYVRTLPPEEQKRLRHLWASLTHVLTLSGRHFLEMTPRQ
ncbi:MAG TPA: DUF3106 domain-containing protein, partial [Arenimonas sp.]|nr:DUF3106 domain-containing protein [Arenimonas sp.]